MTIQELKKAIETNTLDDSPLILCYEGDEFLCRQYVRAIAKNKNIETKYIESIVEIPTDDIFGIEPTLFVIDVEKFVEYIDESFKNLVVICKKVDVNLPIDFIQMPKAVNWQIEDYVKMRVPGLTKEQIKWLCEVCKYDVYRLSQECAKLEIFPENYQSIMFDQESQENAFSDVSSLTIFNLTQAIVDRDINAIAHVLTEATSGAAYTIDIEPAGLVTILVNQYKKLVTIAGSAAWNANLGVTEKQFYYLKNNTCKKYPFETLQKIYEMLLSVDVMLKSGDLEYNRIVDYVIENTIGV